MSITDSAFPIALPAHEGDDLAGAPSGDAAATDPSTQVAEPTVIEVDDNALIKPKGFAKPVKYGEHVGGLQAQFTKASQRAAQLERELQAERTRREQFERQSQQQRGQQGQPDVFDALRQLPYLTGEDAAGVVQSIAQQIQQRDQVLLAALNRMKQMEGIVQGLHQSSTNSSFESKINNWLDQGGYSRDYADLAKEVYLAYEGDDLDQEFPQIFSARVEQIRKAIEAERAAKLNAARKVPFVPGRGGQTGPSKPLTLSGKENPKDIADQLWETFQVPGT